MASSSSAATARQMLAPCFGHMARSVAGLVLVEKLVMDYALPPWAWQLQALEASLGRAWFLVSGMVLVGGAAYWGIGGILAVPACLRIKGWKIQRNRTMDFGALLASMPLVVFNVTAGLALYGFLLATLLPESCFDWSRLPGSGTLARDVVAWLLLQEVSFFYVHRFFHANKRAYAAVHKKHHTWTAPVSLVAAYCHPLENIVANMLPLALGPLLCRSHVASVFVFVFLALYHIVSVHSGYWFCDDGGMHDEHHAKFSVNYGSAGWMDILYGTYRLPAGGAGHSVAKEH